MAVQKTKHPMPEQKPKDRIKNFNEVPYGYDEKTAIEEAKRCLQCKNRPCVDGCPVEIDILSSAEHRFQHKGVISPGGTGAARITDARDIITVNPAGNAIVYYQAA